VNIGACHMSYNMPLLLIYIIIILLFFFRIRKEKMWNSGIGADNQAVRSKKCGI
jgi:hypothetical protein